MMSFGRHSNSPTKITSNLCCSVCNLQFFIRDLTLRKSKCPLLLFCGHAMCGSCLWQKAKITDDILCRQCGFHSTLKSTEHFNETFPLDKYLTGSIVEFQNTKSRSDRRVFVNHELTKDSKPLLRSKSVECEECSTTPASCYCDICRSNYCEICWSKIHSFAKSLMRHVKRVIICNQLEGNALMSCPKHETQKLEFYCKVCQCVVCSHCVIQDHQGDGHCSITLKEKNTDMIKKVKIAASEAEMISKRMRETLEEIQRLKSSDEGLGKQSHLELEKEISLKFAHLHGILQMEERRLVTLLGEAAQQRLNLLDGLNSQLNSYLESTGNLLGESDAFLQNPESWNRDVTNLYQKLLTVKTLPCHLIPRAKDQIKVTLEFDESLIVSLRRFCILGLHTNEGIYELVSDENFSIDSHEESLDFQEISKKQEDNYSGEDLPIAELCGDASQKLNEGENYPVRLSYLKDPSEFYVTLNSQGMVHKFIEQKMKDVDFCPLLPEAVIKDELYLVKTGTDGKLYRARALNRLPEDSPGEPSARVCYLDFGNSEIVPISRMSLLPEDLKKIPPLAIKCKLSGCVPVGGEWCAESVNVVERILDKSIITMFVIKINQDCLEVDLGVGGEGRIATDFESVRDALLFFEFASLTGGARRIKRPKLLTYLSQSLPSRGETFQVVVTHANSPDDFYVQRTQQDCGHVLKLSNDMKTYYNLNPQKGTVYNPTIGMPCAALHSQEKKWYRAQIIGIPGKKMVTVFYVDYGNTETVPWTTIRKLKEVFFIKPPLAFNCSLAGIQPKSSEWDSASKSYMASFIEQTDLRIFVHGSRPSRGSGNLKVSLYEKEYQKEVCVNSSFVDLGLAVSISPRFVSSAGVIPKSSKKVQGSDRLKTEKTKRKPTAAELRAMHAAKGENSSGVSSAREVKASPIEVKKSDGHFRVKVHVLSAESPSSIYVAFPAMRETLRSLKAQMAEFYENTSAKDGKQWEIGSKCAVFYSEESSWFRASVLALLPDKMIKLFLTDVATVSTVSASSLRELDPLFDNYPNCAFKCNLANVAPVGKAWPGVSCEFFSMMLEKYTDVYITRKGNMKNNSFPVEIWVEKVASEGALEPLKKQWITLNEVLVSQGLAVPLKTYMEFPGAFSKEKTSTNHNLEKGSEAEEAAQDLVAVSPVVEPKWLPPLPLGTSRFIGRPTYVDFDGSIYIHDVEKDDDTLKYIRDTLMEDYQNSDDPRPDDRIWCPQQLCTVRFHLDQCWYRGLVLSVNEDFTYEVLFVDYGNVETCSASDLRDAIKMIEIPVLTHKFCLRDIAPVSRDGKWSVKVIETLHSLVVDKMCEVNVFFESPDPSQPSIISLIVTGGEVEFDVGIQLLKAGLAQTVSGVDYFVENFDEPDEFTLVVKPPNVVPLPLMPPQPPPVMNMREHRDEVAVNVDCSRYPSLRIPKEIQGLFVKVIIPSSKTITTNLIDHESLPSELRRIVQDFELIKEELAECCPTQPILETFSPGQPCCCVHPVLREWCRAEVDTLCPLSDTVDVTLVDTGFKEVLERNCVLECKPEWLRVPKMAVKFNLPPDSDFRDVFSQDYLDSVFYAQILDRHEDFFEGTLSKVD